MYMLIKYIQYVARGKVLHVPNKNRLIVVISIVTLTIINKNYNYFNTCMRDQEHL